MVGDGSRRVEEEILGITTSKKGSYRDGYRYCGRCGRYYLTDSLKCPVCRSFLRRRSRKYNAGPRGERRAVAVTPELELERELEEIDFKMVEDG